MSRLLTTLKYEFQNQSMVKTYHATYEEEFLLYLASKVADAFAEDQFR
jgi:hypothetical protein